MVEFQYDSISPTFKVAEYNLSIDKSSENFVELPLKEYTCIELFNKIIEENPLVLLELILNKIRNKFPSVLIKYKNTLLDLAKDIYFIDKLDRIL